MAEKKLTRIYRRLTPEERAHDAEVRKAVEAEKPELEAGVRESVDRYESTLVRYLRIQGVFDVEGAVAALKSAREEQGLSLAAVSDRTDIAESDLSDLEAGETSNPTLRTLQRYAQAVGRRFALGLVEAEAGEAEAGEVAEIQPRPDAKTTDRREAG